jgi:hypothetical protein
MIKTHWLIGAIISCRLSLACASANNDVVQPCSLIQTVDVYSTATTITIPRTIHLLNIVIKHLSYW